MDDLQHDYPWTKNPLVIGAPMRLIALAALATEISKAGGLGFIGAGSDTANLQSILEEVKRSIADAPNLKNVKDVLPVGVGFICWAGQKLLKEALPSIEKYRPAAVWLFAPREHEDLVRWSEEVRRVTQGKTKIWIQVGTVENAVEVTKSCQPDVLVVQGQDAGGHGLHKAAGIIALLPEVDDTITALCKTETIKKPALVAAGGIMDGRGAAAALTLGASGLVLGTRYLASPEANIAEGYRQAVVEATDGGQMTERTKLYDQLRGTTDWPDEYGGRGVLNESHSDAGKGMTFEENKRLYDEAMKTGDEGWGKNARLTTYAGTGVGLVREVKGAAAIAEETREDARKILRSMSSKL